MPPHARRPLAGTRIAITRPVGSGAALARQVRALGGSPLLLPGSSLRAPADPAAARIALQQALACPIVIFTSPAALRFARALAPLRTRARLLAPGAGTLRALRRAGFDKVLAPAREDSEGILALPWLADLQGQRVGIIGAAGGRGLLDRELAARGARVVHAHVYQRLPARLGPRHAEALRDPSGAPLFVLLSSAEGLANILASLPADARLRLLDAVAVASSTRLAAIARRAGFDKILLAASAQGSALLEAIVARRG